MKAMVLRLSPGATTMIKTDHAYVLSTFHSYRIDLPADKKRTLVDTLGAALEIHAKLEEEIFYPAMRRYDADLVDKSIPEHNEMRRRLARRRDRCQCRALIPGRDVGADERGRAHRVPRRACFGTVAANARDSCVQCHSQISACEKSA